MTTILSDLGIESVLPEIVLACGAMFLLVVGAVSRSVITNTVSYAAVLLLLLTFFLTVSLDWSTAVTMNGFFVMDRFAGVVKSLILLAMAVVLLLSTGYMKRERITAHEYPVLLLLAALGMMIMVSANDLMSLYIGLELQSLSLYVLAAIRRNSLKSAEAGIKYFILGALSSGMVLFGSSIIYGFSGTTNFAGIAQALAYLPQVHLGVSLGFVFLLAGLAFKISAVPFHMWTPDVYEGAPMSVTALFAIVPKLAAAALLMRIFYEPFAELEPVWGQIMWGLAAASMIVGALAGLGQTNIKRLLAYSSIGNMGYAMIGLIAGGADGAGATLYYFIIYMVMTAATFGVLMSLRRDGTALEEIEHMEGLSKTHPVTAYVMAALMFSMSGIPPLAGFFGKLFIFQTAIESGLIVLAVLGVVSSVVAAYYYLRIIKVMFFDDAVESLEHEPNVPRDAVILVSMAAVLGLVIMPEPLLNVARAASSVLF
ncbi:MAG: NADH-quinone oxidoreductase subunit NuoN [Rhodospirillales bacterium]|nr:NADH-quinone oxidoreductase subunit NuoN [Rhodospirillales bacterium]MCB9965192.1 NADH-quinone oxidoreductase subunit NuoN [Rhodospirillales bacterium]MCB9973211.1 NADH-quinone oxidoreductase subunit NuoN [Rhodospirillales bacterium]MCB9979529.1 NADH-quinone oxidoreductase subunit NuoN [Rhodospirillales bacterium]